MTEKPRQRVLDEYYPRSIRVVEVYQHGRMVPVLEEDFKAMRKARANVVL